MDATLLTTLDAKHCKPGKQVKAKTTRDVKQNGRVVLRKGTRLFGHVTEASARSKNHAKSTLGVVFDRALLRNGQEVPLHLSIQALAAAASATSADLGDEDALASTGNAGFAGGGAAAMPAMPAAPAVGGGGRTAGGLVAGAGGLAGGAVNSTGAFATHTGGLANSAAGATAHSATSAASGVRGATGGVNAAGALTSKSSGVFGLNGLSLNSATSSVGDASVVTSTTRNVHLASGTQMVLEVVR